MSYKIDDKKLPLTALKQRIEKTDLVPSREILKKSLEKIVDAFLRYGIQNVYELRQILKNNKKMEAISQGTGISSEILILLRREVEGYFPRPFPLDQFNWMPDDVIQKCLEWGIHDTAELYCAVKNEFLEAKIFENSEPISAKMIELAKLSDLTRVQWVNPTTARMIMEAGYDSVKKLSEADPDELCTRLDNVNNAGGYFRGKVGLRDVKRLVFGASFLPD